MCCWFQNGRLTRTNRNVFSWFRRVHSHSACCSRIDPCSNLILSRQLTILTPWELVQDIGLFTCSIVAGASKYRSIFVKCDLARCKVYSVEQIFVDCVHSRAASLSRVSSLHFDLHIGTKCNAHAIYYTSVNRSRPLLNIHVAERTASIYY